MKQSMLSLKLASKEDAPHVLPILKKLFESSIYSNVVEWDEKSVIETFNATVDNGVVILLVSDINPVGVIAASDVKHLFNRKHKTAVELAFWIEEEFRKVSNIKKLLGAYRYWAKMVGCHSILMGKLKNKNEVETYTIRKLK